MRITVEVSEATAIAAVAQWLYEHPGQSITSYNHFMKEVRQYVELFGASSVDDHQYEGGKFEPAQEIVNKYFKY